MLLAELRYSPERRTTRFSRPKHFQRLIARDGVDAVHLYRALPQADDAASTRQAARPSSPRSTPTRRAAWTICTPRAKRGRRRRRTCWPALRPRSFSASWCAPADARHTCPQNLSAESTVAALCLPYCAFRCSFSLCPHSSSMPRRVTDGGVGGERA